MRTLLLSLTALFLVASCSSDVGSPDSSPTSQGSAAPTSASDDPTPALVGMWERETTCEEMVAAFESVGMSPLAPTALAGNGLVTGTTQQIARKDDPCAGAKPRLHSHFFTEDGRFGSLDWRGQQVDDGAYEILDASTLRIGPEGRGMEFDYEIDGEVLTLEPVIPPSAKKKALQNPTEFSPPLWGVSVGFGGLPWNRADCGGWC